MLALDLTGSGMVGGEEAFPKGPPVEGQKGWVDFGRERQATVRWP